MSLGQRQREEFRKELVDEVCVFQIKQGAFTERVPQLRVQVYGDAFTESSDYGPIMLVFDLLDPQDPKRSKPYAQMHMDEEQATMLIAALIEAITRFRPGMTARDVIERALELRRRLRR